MKFLIERSTRGDPFDKENTTCIRNLVKAMRETYPNCIIEVHTRYTYEHLVFESKFDVVVILKNIDILADGRKRKYVIDVQESLKRGVVIPYNVVNKKWGVENV